MSQEFLHSDNPRRTEGMEDSVREFWNAVQESFGEDARRVLQLVKERGNVIVLGPHRIGKSEAFKPQLQKMAEQDGYRVGISSGLEHGFMENQINMDVLGMNEEQWQHETAPKLLIVDEALRMIENLDEASAKEIILEVFSSLRQTHTSSVLMIATKSKRDREEEAERWGALAQELNISTAVHQLESIHISKDVVRKLLESWGAQDDLIDFFLADQNQTLRTVGVMDKFLSAFEYGRVPPFQTLENLRGYLRKNENYREWPKYHYIGGSKGDWFAMIKNLVVVSDDELESWRGTIPDYD